MAQSLLTLLCAARLAEQKSIDALKGKLEIIDDEEVHKKFQEHLVESQWQLKLLEACLEFQGVGRDYFDAEAYRLVNALPKRDVFTIKQFEIELYKLIVAAARESNALEALQSCREILEQETAMAEWIEMNTFHAETPFTPQERASFSAALH